MSHYDREREKQAMQHKEDKRRTEIVKVLEEVFDDVMLVFDFGAKKHPDSAETPNFLMENGNKCSRTVRGNSCLHHAADVRAGVLKDHESGLDPALHLISSAVILYIRQKRGIIHPDDAKITPKPDKTSETTQLTGLCGWSYAGETNERGDR